MAARRGTGGNIVIFPEKLHSILDRIEADGLASIVSWLPHGKAFKIHNEEKFSSAILPKYFWLLKASFQRQLNIYGFKRVKTGPDRGALYHELFLRDKPQLCKGMTRRINVKEKRLAEERAKRENFGKLPEEGKNNNSVPKAGSDHPARQAPPSLAQPAPGPSREQQNPPLAVPTVNPHSLPVPRAPIGPDRQPMYIGQSPSRVPGDPLHLRGAVAPPPVESIDGRLMPNELLHRDWDLRRQLYESEVLHHSRGELLHGRGELLHGRNAALAGYPPEYSPHDPRERAAMLAHREGGALYHLESHPPHRVASLQDRYDLDRDFLLRDELVYGPRAPLPASAPLYPPVGLPPRTEAVHAPAGAAHDPRIAPQAMMGHIRSVSGPYPGEGASSAHGARSVGAAPPSVFPSERRRVDDAMLLLLLNENSH